jgi:hypothetical protein
MLPPPRLKPVVGDAKMVAAIARPWLRVEHLWNRYGFSTRLSLPKWIASFNESYEIGTRPVPPNVTSLLLPQLRATTRPFNSMSQHSAVRACSCELALSRPFQMKPEIPGCSFRPIAQAQRHTLSASRPRKVKRNLTQLTNWLVKYLQQPLAGKISLEFAVVGRRCSESLLIFDGAPLVPVNYPVM